MWQQQALFFMRLLLLGERKNFTGIESSWVLDRASSIEKQTNKVEATRSVPAIGVRLTPATNLEITNVTITRIPRGTIYVPRGLKH